MPDKTLEPEFPPFLVADEVDAQTGRKDSEFNTSVVYSCCYSG